MKVIMKVIIAILAIFIVAPIWYYLLYKILVAVNASELMWFLYWIYMPVGILVKTLQNLTEEK